MNIKHKISLIIPRNLTLQIKYLYQQFSRLKGLKKIIETNYSYQCISKKDHHVFFGYYDVSPFNPQSEEIIYLTLGKSDSKVKIVLNNINDYNKECVIAESRAWNWQQGVRLRWMPNDSRKIIFNDFNGDSYYSRIIDVDTKSERIIDYPLYDISGDGRYGLSIDFERLGEKRPGYGYTCRPYNEDLSSLGRNSIDLVDLNNGAKKTIITYDDIAKIEGCDTTDFRKNYLNHICFSPSGNKFLFFWLTIEGTMHKAYLLVHDLKSGETKLLEGKEKVSHYRWQDEDNIICTAIDENKNEHYYLYTVSTGEKKLLAPEILNRDGHPSIYTDNVLITDTYPDLKGYQHLYLADVNSLKKTSLLNIYSNCKITGEKRTDLHPRYDSRLQMICIDVNPERNRQMIIVKL